MRPLWRSVAVRAWQAEQKRIRDDANKARSEAMAGVPYAGKGQVRKPEEKVGPQVVGAPSSEPQSQAPSPPSYSSKLEEQTHCPFLPKANLAHG